MKRKLFLLVVIFALFFVFACSAQKPYSPLNRAAQKNCTSSDSPYMFYSLSSNFFESNTQNSTLNNALELTLSTETDFSTVTVAFLYDSDFNGKKLISKLPVRDVAEFRVSKDFATTTVSFAFLPEIKNQIKGFLVHSENPVKLLNAKSAKPKLGFLQTKNPEKSNFWYGFGVNGGKSTEKIVTTVDFSSHKALCNSDESEQFLLYFDNSQNQAFNNQKEYVNLTANNKKFSILRADGQSTLHFYKENFGNSLSNVEFTQNQNMISGFVCSFEPKTQATEPILVDPGLVLNWPSNTWQNKELIIFAWEQFPDILIFDTANYDVQDKLLKRLAFFAEKEGFRGRLAHDSEIAELHGYNAHDYRPETLADFFDLAQKQNFPLNSYEQDLCKLLEDRKIIIKTETGYKAGKGALVSISQEIPSYNRAHLFAHECMHALYFVEPDFRDIVDLVYDIIDEKSLQFLKGFFKSQPSLGYDPNDPYLMKNELMGYLLQQPISRIPNYFAENLANRGTVLRAIPELAAYVRNTNAQGFVDAAKILESFLQTKWNFAAGRINLVSVQ